MKTTTDTYNNYTITLKAGDTCFIDANEKRQVTGDRLVVTDTEKKQALHMEFTDNGAMRLFGGKPVDSMTEADKAKLENVKQAVEQCESFKGSVVADYVRKASYQVSQYNNG